MHIATNQYPWGTFYRRQGLDYADNLERVLDEVVEAGIHGYEPIANTPDDIDALAALLKPRGLEMRSLYVNSELHEEDKAAETITQVVTIAERAKAVLGTSIVVTNPSPIKWGDDADKSDEQLRIQAVALNRLGESLAEHSITLSYHIHAPEMRNSAREFHHMLLSSTPNNVTLCLDAHWIYRGAGNSNVALFDIIKLYGERVTELHVRQSRDHVWTETFCDGDIDWAAIWNELKSQGLTPHIVLEQAVEADSPNTMDALEAHKISMEYAEKLFGGD